MIFRVPCFNSSDMIRPIFTVAFESAHSVPVHRNVLINDISSLEILEQYDWNTEKKDCDGSDPEYEYYDLDVGLGIHEDIEDESSGDEEIFDMPSFEALIGDNPNQGKETGKEYDPYMTNDGPLVAATLYRKYEYAEGIKNDREVIVEKTENVVENILGKLRHSVEQ